jgi:site-specific DNA-methyltransferase (adenine-specific)
MNIKINTILNEDCLQTMNNMPNKFVDLVITSPPYNICVNRKGGLSDKGKYDVYKDNKTEEEYINWTIDIFNGYDKILKDNRVVIYNFGYSIEDPSLPYKIVSEISNNTQWQLVDTIVWKKRNSIPHPASYNRLNRVWEFIWVFARKTELKTFKTAKKVVSTSDRKQNYYEIFDNYVEAKNNDGPNFLNKATFSTDLVTKLIRMYGFENDLIYDNFMGVGTTAIAAIINNCNYIGSEISKDQCLLAEEKINKRIELISSSSEANFL